MYTYKETTPQTYKHLNKNRNNTFRYGNLRLKELKKMSYPFFDATKYHSDGSTNYVKFNQEISLLNFFYENEENESFFKCKIAIQNVQIDPKIHDKSYIVIEHLTHYTIIEREFDIFPYNPLLFKDMNDQKCIRIALDFSLESKSKSKSKFKEKNLTFDKIQKVILELMDKMGIRYKSIDDIYIA